jgi:hypothetical protein
MGVLASEGMPSERGHESSGKESNRTIACPCLALPRGAPLRMMKRFLRKASSGTRCRRLRWIYEYSFLLNVIWPIVWFERSNHKYAGGPIIAAYFFRIIHRAIPLFSERDSILRLEQIVWSLICAAILFMFLRTLSLFLMTDTALQAMAGPFAVALWPLVVVIYPGMVSVNAYDRGESYTPAFFLEIVVILLCTTFYYLRKPIFSIPVMLVILIAHFAFWTLLTHSYDNFPECIHDFRNTNYYHPWRRTLSVCSLRLLFDCGFPIIGLLASLSWMRYLTWGRHSEKWLRSEP